MVRRIQKKASAVLLAFAMVFGILPAAGLGTVKTFASSVVFSSIDAGGSHTLALDSNGNVWAWGKNDKGQLGTGDQLERNVPTKLTIEEGGSSVQFVAVSAGTQHSVALDSAGNIWDWGINDKGALGTGSISTPVLAPVKLTTISGVSAVAAGSHFTLALKTNGEVWAWGDDYYGTVGVDLGIANPNVNYSATPVQVKYDDNGTLVPLLAKRVSASDGQSFVIDLQDSLWFWGLNGATDTVNGLPSKVLNAGGAEIKAKAVSGGNHFYTFVDLAGDVWTSGDNYGGRLGIGNSDFDFKSSLPVKVSGISDVVAISAGYGHVLAIDSNDKVWAWGYNGYSQLGDKSNVDRIMPVQVRNSNGSTFLNADALASGGTWLDSHSIALKNGQLIGWGNNADGRLGNGNTDIKNYAEDIAPPDVYTVSYNSNSGSAVPSNSDVSSGSTITEPTAPTRSGYTFDGWHADEETTDSWDFSTEQVTADITLFAKWTALATYAITFDEAEGSAVSDLSNVVTGSKIAAPTTPTRQGYTFDGWYKESAHTTAWDFDNDTVTSNITLYAKWTELKVWLNNGKMKFGNTADGQSINAAGNLNQPYYFNSSWFKLTFGTNALQSMLMIGGDGTSSWNSDGSTYYSAVRPSSTWDIVPMNEVSMDSSQYDAESQTGIVTVTGKVTIDGKTLLVQHVYTLLADKSYIKVRSKVTNISGESVLNVRFIVGTSDDYIGTDDSPDKTRGNIVDGAFAPIASQTAQAKVLKAVSSDSGALLISTSPSAQALIGNSLTLDALRTRDPAITPISALGTDSSYGMYFRLTDLADGASDSFNWYYAAGSIASLSQVIADLDNDIVKHTVTFNRNDGTATDPYATISVVEGEAAGQLPTAPVRTGYTFEGWYVNADGSGAAFTAGTPVTSALQIYAKWTALAYTVTFDEAEGSDVSDLSNVVTGSKISAPTTPTRQGYTFVGWYKEAAYTTAWDFDNDMVTSNVTLYAKWIIATYTVTFEEAEGSDVSDLSNVVTGSKISAPTAPTRQGYTFAGWYKEPACTTAWDFDNDTVTSNVTLYAKWTMNPVLGGGTTAPTKEVITVDVEDGSNDNGSVVSKATIERTTDANGNKKDDVTFTNEQASKTAEQLEAAGSNTAKIVIPDPKDEVSELNVKLPEASTGTLANQGLNLEINTPNVRIVIPSASLQALGDDKYFRLVPIKAESERQQVEERARTEQVVREAAGNDTISVVGRPMTIETNMQSRKVELILPIGNVSLTDEQLKDLGIFIEHSDGTKELVKGEIIPYDATGKKGIRFTINKFSTFTIVHMEGWQQTLLEGEGGQTHEPYILGFPNGTFGPEKPITREEMAAILSRVLSKSETVAPMTFKDVDAKRWSNAAVEKVTKMGLMVGYKDGSFRPKQSITRAEMAAIVARLIETETMGSGFPDVAAAHWAADAIRTVQAAGLLKGYNDGTFRPKAQLTRAEAVTLINRLLGRGPVTGIDAKWSDVTAKHWAFGDVQEASIGHRVESVTNGVEKGVKKSS
ncbi:InlB B-repeat-containing protein [Cohnella suwonensis]|uniref:InlB B-repeat-containing protein n=1 Tax=Cohnella suwonensis TaxID=696072 RepID=A0ABW0LNN6_9BACL